MKIVGLLSLLALQGCVKGRGLFVSKDGAKRAAFELKCTEPELKIVELNDQTVGVEGCGQSAVYKWVQTSQYGYDWIRD